MILTLSLKKQIVSLKPLQSHRFTVSLFMTSAKHTELQVHNSQRSKSEMCTRTCLQVESYTMCAVQVCNLCSPVENQPIGKIAYLPYGPMNPCTNRHYWLLRLLSRFLMFYTILTNTGQYTSGLWAPTSSRSCAPYWLTVVGCLVGELSLQEQLWLSVSLKMSSSGQCCRLVRLRGRDCTSKWQRVEQEAT